MSNLIPLNGSKTHPLSSYALNVLEQIARTPMPSQEVNPGVVNRLLREELVISQEQDSPYKTRSGKVSYLHITTAGTQVLKDRK